MPTLKPVEIKNTDDVEPAVIPFVGMKNGEKITTEIRFAGRLPAGVALDMIEVTDAKGNVNYNAAIKYVNDCVLEEDKAKWDELVHLTQIIVEQSHVLAAYELLGNFYTNRPTKRRSDSRTGPSSTKPTSRPAASSRTSSAKHSR